MLAYNVRRHTTADRRETRTKIGMSGQLSLNPVSP